MNKTLLALSIPAALLICCALESCAEVKPYHKARLDDYSMRLGTWDIERIDQELHAYREGASGGGAKSSGGCGCN